MDFVKEALKTEAKYIGLIGSKVKHVFIKNSLIQDGFSEEEINRIYGKYDAVHLSLYFLFFAKIRLFLLVMIQCAE